MIAPSNTIFHLANMRCDIHDGFWPRSRFQSRLPCSWAWVGVNTKKHVMNKLIQNATLLALIS